MNIKPCSSCGDRMPRFKAWSLPTERPEFSYFVECSVCQRSTMYYEDLEDAIEEWNSREDMKVCPFCKGNPVLINNKSYALLQDGEQWMPKESVFYVKCGSCGIETDVFTEKEEAVSAWEKRAY